MMFQFASFPAGGDAVLEIIAMVIGLALAVVLHEVAHGYAALYLGDPTAKYAGRLSLNPIAHIDLFGTVILPLLQIITFGSVGLAWAKPVPVNYYNLRHGKYGPALVALAGPATNLVLVIIFGLLVRFVPAESQLPMLFGRIALINAMLMLFNLIPVPPLDGSKILYLFLDRRPDVVMWMERYGMYVLLALIVLGGGVLNNLVFTPAVRLVGWIAGL